MGEILVIFFSLVLCAAFTVRSHTFSEKNVYLDLLPVDRIYTTKISIGSPPQTFVLGVNTQSALTFVRCSPGTDKAWYNTELSQTCQYIECNNECKCDEEQHCLYDKMYGHFSESSGFLVKDAVSFRNLSEPKELTFGCAMVESDDDYSKKADGMMGLGHGDLSILNQLVNYSDIRNSFSLCFGGTGGGAMVLGAISTPKDMVYTSSSAYDRIVLKEIHVAGKTLEIHIIDDRTMVDTTVMMWYLPTQAYLAVKTAVLSEVIYQKVYAVAVGDLTCFYGAQSDISLGLKHFPPIDLYFGDGGNYTLTPENYLFRHSDAYCLGVAENIENDFTILGGILFQNVLLTYDRERKRIGFWKTDCSIFLHTLEELSSPPPSHISHDLQHVGIIVGISIAVCVVIIGLGTWIRARIRRTSRSCGYVTELQQL